ncbi:MAG: class I tRNA ligase family protein, partial [Anaerolineae bacterium]|nr:class I tRNA ligase family protein [Anaerolineae bacterium]
MDWNNPDELRFLADKLGEDPSQTLTLQGPDGPVTSTVEDLVGRLGLPELGGSYFTFSNENNYMIWRFLQECQRRGWLYRGVDVMPWCPRCATGISQHEIVTDGYQERTHRSVCLRLPLRHEENASLLVWTTTPWTLTSNVAAAVGPDLRYVQVRQGDETLYLSRGALEMLQGAYEVVRELPGSAMVGWTYDGPFDELPTSQRPGGYIALDTDLDTATASAAEAHVVIPWDAVGEQEGTG